MSISSEDFNYLRQLVRDYSAVTLDAGKEYLANLHLSSLVRRTGFSTIGDFVESLRVSPFGKFHVETIESLVNYETSFFRDTFPFDALKNYILPEIIRRRHFENSLPKLDKIKIWSAACSSGQEPYSIAMLVREHFPTLDQANLEIIASDFSSQVLARAVNGVYSQLEVRRGLPASLRKKYFQPDGNGWRINPEVRSMIDFRQINLIEPWQSIALQQIDIIFLRNVLIYFDIDSKKNILYKIRQVLNPGGYLFLGGGETTFNLDTEFERVQLSNTIAYRLKPLTSVA